MEDLVVARDLNFENAEKYVGKFVTTKVLPDMFINMRVIGILNDHGRIRFMCTPESGRGTGYFDSIREVQTKGE